MSKPVLLKNGIPVHLISVPGTQAATVLALVKVGSRYEYQAINGASHFIEHLMFKGTKRRPSTLDISRALDAVGAEYNAYTGKDITGYHVTAAAEHAPLAIDILHDMMFNSVYDKKELDRERGVIIEEINMYKDNPMMHVEELMEQAMYEGNTLGWDIAGTPELMRSMTRDNIIAYRDMYYDPSRLVLAVAGNIDAAKILALLEKTFGKVKGKGEPAKPFEVMPVLGKTKKPRARVQFKETEQIQVALGFPSYAVNDERNAAVGVLATILGGTMSSRLFVSVRERKGLCYFVRAGNSTYEDTGVFMVQSGIEKARLPLAVKTILAELRKIKKDGVTPRELREAKDNTRGRLRLRLEESSNQAEWYARQQLFLGKTKTPDEKLADMDKVTAAQVKAAANDILDFAKMSVGSVGPFKDVDEFFKAAGI